MLYSNFHTHTNFCDGSENPEKYVLEAIEKNMLSVGFSGHAPVSFENEWSIKHNNLENYCSTIQSLKVKYKNKINIFLGLEIDYIPGITEEFNSFWEKCNLDFAIGSVHLVRKDNSEELWFIDGPVENYSKGLNNLFDNDIKTAVGYYYKQVIEMIETQKFNIIGHFDKIKMNNKGNYFNGDEKWNVEYIMQTIDAIEKYGIIVEINTRGIYKGKTNSLFPDNWVIKELFSRKIPITISTDAHKPFELLNYYSETLDIIKEIGFKELFIFDGKSWVGKEII